MLKIYSGENNLRLSCQNIFVGHHHKDVNSHNLKYRIFSSCSFGNICNINRVVTILQMYHSPKCQYQGKYVGWLRSHSVSLRPNGMAPKSLPVPLLGHQQQGYLGLLRVRLSSSSSEKHLIYSHSSMGWIHLSPFIDEETEISTG